MKKRQRYFKGFNSELECLHAGRKLQYKVGGIFTAHEPEKEPKICSSSVLHFCQNLSDTFSYYPFKNGNRYCEVRPVPGEKIVSDDGVVSPKLGCRHIQILREIPREVVKRYILFKEYLSRRQEVIDNHRLSLVAELQKRHPELILCGSAAVFLLTGKVYSRNQYSPIHDLDFVSPYYVRIEGDTEEKLQELYQKLDTFDDQGLERSKANLLKVSKRDRWGSGNDFDEVVYVNDVPCDIAVNPHCKYQYVTFRGVRYKVASLPSILAAKLKYAEGGNEKHWQDIQDLINLPKTFEIK